MRATNLLRSLFTSNAQPRQRTVRLGLDNLERRDTPAGTVTASLSANGKTWTITGDDQANDITIEPLGGGSFMLTGTDTVVDGAIEPTTVENIVIKLKQGRDLITMNTSNTMSTLAGNLTIDGGHGANGIYIYDMTISKNVSIKNGTNTASYDEVRLEDSNVNGNVSISNGEGDTYTLIARNDEGSSVIGGNLKIVNGTGNDGVQILDVDVNKNVNISNGAPDASNNPGYTQFYNNHNLGSQSSVQGNIKVRYSGGVNSGNERDGLWDYDVQGNVSFNYGSGQGDVRFDGYNVVEPTMIHGNLTIKSGGALVAKVANQGYTDQGLWVGGNLTINAGIENDNLNFKFLVVDGNTLIKTADGNDSVTIDDSIFAKFTLNTYKGNDSVSLDYWDSTPGTTQFTGVVSVNLGNGDDEAYIGYPDNDTALVAFGDTATFLGGNGTDSIFNDNFIALNGDPITILA